MEHIDGAGKSPVTLDFPRPGKPTDNVFVEAFNTRLRAKRLNAHWFLGFADAAEKLEAWRRDYNEQRPHGSTTDEATATGGAPSLQGLLRGTEHELGSSSHGEDADFRRYAG